MPNVKENAETGEVRDTGADENPMARSIEDFGHDVFNDFDFNHPIFNERINDVLDEQLRLCPVARSNVGTGYWWVTRNEDIRRIGQDWRTFSSAQGYQPNRMEGMPWIYPVEMDPPYQTAWRRVLNPHLTPAVVESFMPAIRADANELIDRFIDRGECEFISEFGVILPGWAFFKNSLGLSVDMLDDLVTTMEASLFGPLDQRVPQLQRSFDILDKYMKQREKEPPRGDMIDVILKGVTYPDGSEAPWEHKLGIAADLTVGGIGTTTYVMGSALHYLAERPEERQRLIDNPDLMPRAVEEFIRAFPPVIGLGRVCMKDTEVAGTLIKEGDFTLLAYGAASRDPRVIDNPKDVDLSRESVVHATFGVGPHRCIGSNMARAELTATLDEWLKRIPNFSVKPGTNPNYETSQLRQMVDLHLVW